MSASQRILGAKFMVEHDRRPIVLPMTLFAFLSVGPFVPVVFLVAGITIHWGVFKGRCQVAFLAFRLGMLSHQWEARLVMVKWRLLP